VPHWKPLDADAIDKGRGSSRRDLQDGRDRGNPASCLPAIALAADFAEAAMSPSDGGVHPVHPVHPVKKSLSLRSQGPEGRAILARPVRAGNPSTASQKPRRGGTRRRRWATRMCRPYGALRVASRYTGADAPAYNVSPLRGWGKARSSRRDLQDERDRKNPASGPSRSSRQKIFITSISRPGEAAPRRHKHDRTSRVDIAGGSDTMKTKATGRPVRGYPDRQPPIRLFTRRHYEPSEATEHCADSD
jgi:hypothetical protein